MSLACCSCHPLDHCGWPLSAGHYPGYSSNVFTEHVKMVFWNFYLSKGLPDAKESIGIQEIGPGTSPASNPFTNPLRVPGRVMGAPRASVCSSVKHQRLPVLADHVPHFVIDICNILCLCHSKIKAIDITTNRHHF